MPVPDLIVVGDVMLDVTVEAGVLARGGDVHGDVRVQPAGAGANAAVWAASRGARVRLHGRVGRDIPGRLLMDALRERGVDPQLVTDSRARTGTMLVVREGGERSMVADRGANARLSPADLPHRLEAGAVLVSGDLFLGPGSSTAAAAAVARASAPWVAVDAASWPLLEAYGVERFLGATKGANMLAANEREARALAPGTGSLGDVIAELGRHYELVCVKRGPGGAVAAFERRTIEAAAPQVAEVDPTGAGDAFDGVLLGALARDVPLTSGLDAACRAGADAAASLETWPQR